MSRFLNLCSRNGIHLWRIFYDINHFVRVNVRLKDFYLLKPFLRKTKTKLRIISRRGFPFWSHRHPRLRWLFLVALCGICILCYSFNFIWEINISGNNNITKAQILECLEAENTIIGQKSSNIDCSAVEYLIRSNFQEIGWVSVYIKHTNLYIEIKESLYDEYLFDDLSDVRYDFVADKNATIYSMITRSGTAIVKEGDRVQAGDVLVRGECAIYNDIGEVKDVLKLKADALILGDTTYYISFPFTEMEILSLKIANIYNDDILYFLGNQKLDMFIEKLEQNGVIILDKNVMIDKKEKEIIFLSEIKVREKIGINILVEEELENEFE